MARLKAHKTFDFSLTSFPVAAREGEEFCVPDDFVPLIERTIGPVEVIELDRGTRFRGPAGARGEHGPRGEQGPRGERGQAGANGLNGLRGPQGAPGPQGAHGFRGDPGLRGERGEVGPMGPVGPRGPEGRIGITGPRGPHGLPSEIDPNLLVLWDFDNGGVPNGWEDTGRDVGGFRVIRKT